MIFAILTHRLNYAAANNYVVWADGQWFFPEAAIKGLVHSVPPGCFPEGGKGPDPRLAGGRVAESFYQSLFDLIRTTRRFPKTSRGRSRGMGDYWVVAIQSL